MLAAMKLLLLSVISAWSCKGSAATPPTDPSHGPRAGIQLRSPVSISPPTLGVTQNQVSIRRSTQDQPKHEVLRGFLRHDGNQGRSQDSSHHPATTVNLRGTSYIADVTVGTQTIPLLIDTGSADIWIAPSSFVCLSADGNEVPQSECGFPILFRGNVSGGVVPDQYFSIYYGDEQFAYGPFGLETVSLGGTTVSGQQIGLPTTGYIRSSDYAGIFGLGYPGMVAARDGAVPRLSLKSTDSFASYDPWLFSAIKKDLIQPVFSLALNIDGGGLLGIGGAVDIPVTGGYASTPILMVDLVGETRAEAQFTFYTIIADDYLINGQSLSSLSSGTNTTSIGGFPVIVDSGYSFNVLPPSLVDLFYSAFSTAPQLVDMDGSSFFAVACDAEVPSFAVQINNQVFKMTAQDIIVASTNNTVNGTLLCGVGIQPGVEEAGALGEPFLSSVVAVFDIGASEMRFAQRAPDASEAGFGGGRGDMPQANPSKNPTVQDRPSCRAARPRRDGA